MIQLHDKKFEVFIAAEEIDFAIENMAKQKNKVVMILDLVALFGEEELSLVQNLSKTISDKG